MFNAVPYATNSDNSAGVAASNTTAAAPATAAAPTTAPTAAAPTAAGTPTAAAATADHLPIRSDCWTCTVHTWVHL